MKHRVVKWGGKV